MVSSKKHKPTSPPPPPAPLQGLQELLHSPKSGGTWNDMSIFVQNDGTSNNVLMDRNADGLHDAASLTKLATLYTALNELRDTKNEHKLSPDTIVRITPRDVADGKAHEGDSHVHAGQTMPLSEAMAVMMTASDNSVTLAVARTVGQATGKDFMADMRQTMNGIGLKDTAQHLHNPDGMPVKGGENNLTTPREIAALVNRIHTDFPAEAKDYMGRSEITYGSFHSIAHHRLNSPDSPLRLPDGYSAIAKTGFYHDAGFNIASIVTAPESATASAPQNRDLVISVMGSKDRTAEEARQLGVPEEAIRDDMKHWGKVRGSIVRDSVVWQVSQVLQGGMTPQQALVASAERHGLGRHEPEKEVAAAQHPASHPASHHHHRKTTAAALPADQLEQVNRVREQFTLAMDASCTFSTPMARPGKARTPGDA